MIRKLVTGLILVPLAILCVAFAVANRQSVPIVLDPFDPANPALGVSLPLFALVLLLLIVGVVLGGVAAWLRQGKWRRAARAAQAEARRLRAELEEMKRQAATAAPHPLAGAVPGTAVSLRHDTGSRLTIPPPAA